jgi:hypothetical protein
MKRFCLSPVEERLLDRLLSEYLVARRDRTVALADLAKAEDDLRTDPEHHVLHKFDQHAALRRLVAAREAIRLTTDLTHILRTY